MSERKCDTCRHQDDFWVCDTCIHDECLKDNFEPLTNGDRIRAMTDEELSEFLSFGTRSCSGVDSDDCSRTDDCTECRLAWLKKPAWPEVQP